MVQINNMSNEKWDIFTDSMENQMCAQIDEKSQRNELIS